MATQTSFGYTDTAIAAYVAKTLTLAPINFGADFRVSTQAPNEVVLTNLTAPLDQPETFRIAFTNVADIYKGTNIDVSNRISSKAGISIVVQHQSVMKVTDSVDATFSALIPLKEHIVLVVPMSGYCSTAQVITNLCRNLAALFETGTNTQTRLAGIMRGSLTPSDL